LPVLQHRVIPVRYCQQTFILRVTLSVPQEEERVIQVAFVRSCCVLCTEYSVRSTEYRSIIATVSRNSAMSEPRFATVRLVDESAATGKVAAVFADIKRTKKIDFVPRL